MRRLKVTDSVFIATSVISATEELMPYTLLCRAYSQVLSEQQHPTISVLRQFIKEALNLFGEDYKSKARKINVLLNDVLPIIDGRIQAGTLTHKTLNVLKTKMEVRLYGEKKDSAWEV